VPERIKKYYQEFSSSLSQMKQEVPAAVSGFAGLFQKTMADGVLGAKQKELIALGIAVGLQCVPCINLHVQKSAQAGATREEILEAASVAVMMGGGPAYTHIPQVLLALEAQEGKAS